MTYVDPVESAHLTRRRASWSLRVSKLRTVSKRGVACKLRTKVALALALSHDYCRTYPSSKGEGEKGENDIY